VVGGGGGRNFQRRATSNADFHARASFTFTGATFVRRHTFTHGIGPRAHAMFLALLLSSPSSSSTEYVTREELVGLQERLEQRLTAVEAENTALRRRIDGGERGGVSSRARPPLLTSCFSRLGVAVLVQVNSNMMEMWCNWWSHFTRLRLDMPVYVVAHGTNVSTTLVKQFGLPTERVLEPPRMQTGVDTASASNFGSASFCAAASTNERPAVCMHEPWFLTASPCFDSRPADALNTAKIRAVSDLMTRTKRAVIFSDLDTVWLRSPLEELRRLPPGTAFAIGPEGPPPASLDEAKASTKAVTTSVATTSHLVPPPPPPARPHAYVCACFFAACPIEAGRIILEKWWHASGGAEGQSNEQSAFEWMLSLWPELLTGELTDEVPSWRGSGAGHVLGDTGRASLARSTSTITSTSSSGSSSSGKRRLRATKMPRALVTMAAEDNAWAGALLPNVSSLRGASATWGPVSILPHAAFPTGRYDPPITPRAVWVHANWIQRKTRSSTTMAKRNRLIKHGLWNASCTPPDQR
jgi:hypothetical protein